MARDGDFRADEERREVAAREERSSWSVGVGSADAYDERRGRTQKQMQPVAASV